ncbi:hypothetical protein QBC47DRAFT_130915 [Echria macrotheca]|uniref:Secreted protein n=1 Tax=Echria macrotheca TaxID=438768 RepID=A0AAJ0B2L2_9PEZI|nr:hypothetical protein QBC47DRAFT_130915 [Echria macrotheca]
MLHPPCRWHSCMMQVVWLWFSRWLGQPALSAESGVPSRNPSTQNVTKCKSSSRKDFDLCQHTVTECAFRLPRQSSLDITRPAPGLLQHWRPALQTSAMASRSASVPGVTTQISGRPEGQGRDGDPGLCLLGYGGIFSRWPK